MPKSDKDPILDGVDHELPDGPWFTGGAGSGLPLNVADLPISQKKAVQDPDKQSDPNLQGNPNGHF